jgi:hypothetical protein
MDIQEFWCIAARTSKLVDIHELGQGEADVEKAQEAVARSLAAHRSHYPAARLALDNLVACHRRDARAW